jgi:DNA-binding response OmpR family regulator
MNRILIAEDEPRIASFLEKGLSANGFTTITVTQTEEIIDLSLSGNFDLLLLDLGLPQEDGLLILEKLRGQGSPLPIIILTARDDIQDKVIALEGGADDYMTKPFRFEELLARIRLRIRNHEPLVNQAKSVLILGELTLDFKNHQVFFRDKNIDLSLREFTLLETLVVHQCQIMSREQLLDHVWGYNYDPGSNIVDVYIGYLRKKLDNKLIETVRGVGYRLRI